MHNRLSYIREDCKNKLNREFCDSNMIGGGQKLANVAIVEGADFANAEGEEKKVITMTIPKGISVVVFMFGFGLGFLLAKGLKL